MLFLKKRKKKINKHIGKIGWCNARTLGLPKGHFVYIRKVKNGKADVNTFTSLERNNGTIKVDKINHVKNGDIYAVSKQDCNLPLFSGVDKRVIKNVPLKDIKNKNIYHIKGRHKKIINYYIK